MRQASILYKNIEAGRLIQHDDGSLTFKYNDAWFDDNSKPPVSLTLPKTAKEFHSEYMFPFFYNMLPEGSNRQLICRLNRLESNDYFSLLITVAQNDNIGAVKVVKI